MVLPALLLALSAGYARAETVRVRVFSRFEVREAVVEGIRYSAADPALAAGRRLVFASTFSVSVPGAGRRVYAGALGVRAGPEGLVLAAEVPLEEFVAGVVESEAGVLRQPAALEAQAVAVRSYAKAETGRHEGGDFCDLTHCQVFAGLASPGGPARRAAEATRGRVLRRGGAVVPGFYHAECGGTLDAPESLWGGAPVPARPDAPDGGVPFCAAGPNHRWTASLDAGRLAGMLRASGWLPPEEPLAAIVLEEKSPGGRALSLAVVGGRGSRAAVRGEAFLSAAGRAFGWSVLKSAAFALRREGGDFVFTGRGLGHGAGLCQRGAEERARRGQNYRAILAAYFPGAAVGAVASRACTERVCLTGGDAALLALLGREASALPGAPPRFEAAAHPDFDSFRAAGGTGRHAARWLRGTLHLAPPARLAELGILETVVRHEMTHLWVASVAGARAPRWLAEGACVWRAGELAREDPALDEPVLDDGGGRLSYREAGRRAARLVEAGGLAALEAALRR
ncbi:MAG: SpoIID/LytB domain-containing protein [Elusimicrobia bacterium]|nr:SpoIID/LytB domain-containing protein [Elusimicrobiota bacterium]